MIKKITNKNSINLLTEANKVDKIIIGHLKEIGISNHDFDTNFTISGKDRPDVAIKDKIGKYCIIFENKKDFKDLIGAKNQGLKYLEQLKNLNLLSDKILLIRTNMSTFHADEYEIQDGNIFWIKDITSIDVLDDIDIDFIKNYTEPNTPKETKLLSKDKKELKRLFEKMNIYFREKGINSRLEFASAMIFLKLVKENISFLDDIEGKKEEINDLKNYLQNITGNNKPTELNIIDIFKSINRVYSGEFNFAVEQYKNQDKILGLYDILEQIHLSNYDLDIKGEAFEYFINYGTAKSDIGQFFTPRNIVKFMVNLLDLELKKEIEKWFGKTVFDPTCGTGGFLIEIFKKIKQEIGEDKPKFDFLKKHTVHGNELSFETSQIAKMNMILTGDGHSNIETGDFLLKKYEKENCFDITIGNPPFGLGKDKGEALFVDGFLKDIKKGGFSIIVVPEGVLFKSDKESLEIRKVLLNKGKLLKVISLPQGVFMPYTSIKTNIIFWKKETQESNYDIEFFEVKNDGFTLDTHRRKLKNSDLIDYFENKQKLIDNGQIWIVNSNEIYNKTKLNELEINKSTLELEIKGFVGKIEIIKKQLKIIENDEEKSLKQQKINELKNEVENKKNVLKKVNDKLKSFDINLTISRNKPLKAFDDSVKIVNIGNYIEQQKIPNKNKEDIIIYSITNKGIFPTSEVFNENTYSNNDEVKENNLSKYLIGYKSNFVYNPYRINIGSIDLFEEEIGLFSSAYTIFRSIDENILSPKFLKLLLKSDIIKEQINNFSNGSVRQTLSFEEFSRIQIPLPSLEYQEKIISEIEKYEKIINSAKTIIETYNPKIEIKEDWEIVSLGEFSNPEYGVGLEAKSEGKYRYIRITDISEDQLLKNEDKKFIDLELEDEKYILKKGDVLVARTGATYGKTLYFDSDENSAFAGYLIRLNLDSSRILGKYYYYFTFSEYYEKQKLELVSGGGQPQFNANAINSTSKLRRTTKNCRRTGKRARTYKCK